jgi:hypothetical protein
MPETSPPHSILRLGLLCQPFPMGLDRRFLSFDKQRRPYRRQCGNAVVLRDVVCHGARSWFARKRHTLKCRKGQDAFSVMFPIGRLSYVANATSYRPIR